MRRARQADGGDDGARCVANGGGDAAYLILILLQVEGASGAGIAAHPVEPDIIVDRMRARRLVGVEQAAPIGFGIVEQQGLAKAGGGERLAIADAAGDFDAAAAGYLVEIQRLVAVEPAQMHHILAGGGQRLQMRARDLHHIGLALREETQLQQLGPQLIAFAREEGQEAAIDQRIGEAMGGRAREAHAFGQVGELHRAVDHLVQQVETALQRLRPRRLGRFGPVPAVRHILSSSRLWTRFRV